MTYEGEVWTKMFHTMKMFFNSNKTEILNFKYTWRIYERIQFRLPPSVFVVLPDVSNVRCSAPFRGFFHLLSKNDNYNKKKLYWKL